MILKAFLLLILLLVSAGNGLGEDDPFSTPQTRTVVIKAPATDGSITLAGNDPTTKVIFKTKGWYCSEHPVLASHMPDNQLRISLMEKEWEKMKPDNFFTSSGGYSSFVHDLKAGMFWLDVPPAGGTSRNLLSPCYTKEDLEFFKKFILIEHGKFK